MHRALISLFFALIVCTGVSFATEKPVTIGLIHFSPPLSADMDFAPTLSYLRHFFAPRKVEAKIYSSEDLENAVKNGTVDFFYASSGFYYRMLPFGARDLATVVTTAKPRPNFGTAGVFFTRKDRDDIKTLEDMKGKVLGANYPSAFHGFRIGMAELENRGYNHEHFFRSVNFVGESASKILKEVIDGKADVGFIRACWLEEHELQNISVMDKLKVIGAKPGEIACLHSTRAYPNNTFAATYKVDPNLARQMAVALLSMKPGTDGQAWSIATDFKPVDDLYKSLKVGPYQYMREWSAKRFFKEFWPLFLFVFLGIIGLIIHSWRAQKLVDRATSKLLASQERSRAILERSRQLTEKMETQQKINLVGQLSSMFAHEMNQPLAACRYFIDGLKTLRKQHVTPGEEVLDFSLSQMDKELQRASQIVQKVRDYSKKRVARTSKINMAETVKEILQTLSAKFDNQVKVFSELPEGTFIMGDAIEMEILCWNLIKNAMEESLLAPHPEIRVRISSERQKVCLYVENSGRFVSEEALLRLGNETLKSKKTEGLGLGLVVVRSILEAMNGTISFKSRKEGGLIVRVCLNSWEKARDD